MKGVVAERQGTAAVFEQAPAREIRGRGEITPNVLCVAADSYYDESDYIRDYDEFREAVKGKDLD